MKKIGVKYPVSAPYDEATGTHTGGSIVAKAMKIGIKWDKNDAKVYADDGLDDMDNSIYGAAISAALNELPLEKQGELLGHTIIDGEMVKSDNDEAPFVGFGFYGKVKRNNVVKWRSVWLPKIKFGEPDDESETQGEKMTFQTPTIEGTVMKDKDGHFMREKVFDYESDAIAYLNEKAGIGTGQNSSAGLSALTMTGTGGTLSPTFSTGNRYYIFNGLTGNSFTITATAANHTIKLFDGVNLIQTLTSGVASNAISMTSTGTKKLKIVAYESGKASQETEIIVNKTA